VIEKESNKPVIARCNAPKQSRESQNESVSGLLRAELKEQSSFNSSARNDDIKNQDSSQESKHGKFLSAYLFLAFAALAIVIYVLGGWTGETTMPPLYIEQDAEAPPVYAPVAQAAAEILFSHQDYFYEDGIELALQAASPDIAAIYYTLDGSPPDGEKGALYEGELPLTAGREVSPYTVKACGQRADGSFTAVYTHSYFVGPLVRERFDTLIFALSVDPHDLNDYDTGIAVPGRLRREYIAETGIRNPDPPAPANYNMRGREAERPVYVELIDQSGQHILSQSAGVRVVGGWSRAMEQKSLKLYARHDYEPGKNTFDYDFFPDDMSYYGRPITDYNRLFLRNNANDNPFAFLRGETVMSLASAAIKDTQAHRAVAIFLNGKYYGLAWLRQVYNDNYLDDRNEIGDGEWAILEGGEQWMAGDEDNPVDVMAARDYREMYAYNKKDLTDDAVFAEFCELVDIENYLMFYAIQIYVNNNDWPWGNFEVYRYYGEDKIRDGVSTADGKWRWLIQDVDWTLGLYGDGARDLTLGRLLGFIRSDRQPSPLLAAILEREDMRARFVTIMCDIMNQHFSPKSIEQMTRAKEAERLNELTWNFRWGGAQLKRTWSSLDFVDEQIGAILEYGRQRPGEMRKQISKYLPVSHSGFTVTVAAHERAGIRLSTIDINADFAGFYYEISKLEVSASQPDGYVFSHWLVNGQAVAEETLTIGWRDAVAGTVHIELVLKEDENVRPVVRLIDYKGNQDYLEVYNPYTRDIDLRGYYITDNPDEPQKQRLADRRLRAGESVRLYCENYRDYEALGGSSLNFNLKSGEVLTITDMEGAEVFALELPEMAAGYVLARDVRNGGYVGERTRE
jgi:hypothetical protein